MLTNIDMWKLGKFLGKSPENLFGNTRPFVSLLWICLFVQALLFTVFIAQVQKGHTTFKKVSYGLRKEYRYGSTMSDNVVSCAILS